MADPELTCAAVILAAYPEWQTGTCYRCKSHPVPTAVVGRLIRPPAASFDVRACSNCVVELEREREQAAHRYGWPYVPGAISP